MSAAPAAALGIDLLLFAQSPADSGAQVANFEVGDYRDLAQVREFAKNCDLITFEHELIPISVIRALENEGVKFYPTSESFIYSQDKAAMRERLVNYLAPKWQIVTKADEISEFPVVGIPWCSSISLPSVVGTTNGDFWIKYFFMTNA
jgi:5-(carboxyamino)imidazole ribonucleotide synthase